MITGGQFRQKAVSRPISLTLIQFHSGDMGDSVPPSVHDASVSAGSRGLSEVGLFLDVTAGPGPLITLQNYSETFGS